MYTICETPREALNSQWSHQALLDRLNRSTTKFIFTTTVVTPLASFAMGTILGVNNDKKFVNVVWDNGAMEQVQFTEFCQVSFKLSSDTGGSASSGNNLWCNL